MERFGRNIKESMEEVQVPKEKLNRTIAQGILKAKHEKPKRKQRLLVSMASVLMVGIVAVLISGVTFQQGEQGHIYNDSILSQHGEYFQRVLHEGNVQRLDLVAEDNGITIELKEALYNQHDLLVSYYLDIPKELKRIVDGSKQSLRYELTVNGDSLPETAQTIQLNSEHSPFNNLLYLWTKEQAEQLDINLHITEIYGQKGEWNFSYQLEKQYTSDLEYEKIDYVKEAEDDKQIVLTTYRENDALAIYEGYIQVPHLPRYKIDDYKKSVTYSVLQKSDSTPWVKVLEDSDFYVEANRSLNETIVDRHFEQLQVNEIEPILVSFPKEEVKEDSILVLPYRIGKQSLVADFEINSILDLDLQSFNIVNIEYEPTQTKVTLKMETERGFFPFDLFYVQNERKSEFYDVKQFKVHGNEVHLVFPPIEKSVENQLHVREVVDLYDDLILEIRE